MGVFLNPEKSFKEGRIRVENKILYKSAEKLINED